MVSFLSLCLLFFVFYCFPREVHYQKNEPLLRNNFPLSFDLEFSFYTNEKVIPSEDVINNCEYISYEFDLSPEFSKTGKENLKCSWKKHDNTTYMYNMLLSFKDITKPSELNDKFINAKFVGEGLQNFSYSLWSFRMTNNKNANGLYLKNSKIRHQLEDRDEAKLKNGLVIKPNERVTTGIKLSPINYDNHIEQLYYKSYKPSFTKVVTEPTGSDESMELMIDFEEDEFRKYYFIQPHSSLVQT